MSMIYKLKRFCRVLHHWIINKHGYDIISSWWDGEDDLLGTLLHKLDYNIWHIIKYGDHQDSYIITDDLMESCNDNDLKLVYEDNIRNYDKDFLKNHRIYELRGLKAHKLGVDKYIIRGEKEGTKYYIIENSGASVMLLDYNFYNWDMVSSCFKNLDFNINQVFQHMFSYTIKVSPHLYNRLSKPVRNRIRGQRISLHQMFKLRRLLKRYLKIDSFDDEYNQYAIVKSYYTSEELNTDKVKDYLAKVRQQDKDNYMNDRRGLMLSIANIIAEHGHDWWD